MKVFYYQVLIPRILSGLAIYLQNDLKCSGYLVCALQTRHDLIVSELFRIIMENIYIYHDVVLPKLFCVFVSKFVKIICI